jgi:hypothetical protein
MLNECFVLARAVCVCCVWRLVFGLVFSARAVHEEISEAPTGVQGYSSLLL